MSEHLWISPRRRVKFPVYTTGQGRGFRTAKRKLDNGKTVDINTRRRLLTADRDRIIERAHELNETMSLLT